MKLLGVVFGNCHMVSFEVLMVFPNVSTVGMSHESIRFNRRRSSSTILQIIDFTFPGDYMVYSLPNLQGLTVSPHRKQKPRRR